MPKPRKRKKDMGIFVSTEPLEDPEDIKDAKAFMLAEMYGWMQDYIEGFTKMSGMMDKYDCIGDVRVLGAMIGIEFVKDRKTKEPDGELVKDIVAECANTGLIIEAAGTAGNSVRFLAPLVMTDEQTKAGLDIFEAAIKKCMPSDKEIWG